SADFHLKNNSNFYVTHACAALYLTRKISSDESERDVQSWRRGMKSKWSQTMAAALMLCGVLLVLSPSAKASAYVDTTPYGLVFASGTVTGDGSGEAGADYQFYTS